MQSPITLKPAKLTPKESKEPMWTTIGRIRAMSQNTNNPRLLALIDKVGLDINKEINSLLSIKFS